MTTTAGTVSSLIHWECWASGWREIPRVISVPDYTNTESPKAKRVPYDSWRDTFFSKHKSGALWLLICGTLEKNYSLIYLLIWILMDHSTSFHTGPFVLFPALLHDVISNLLTRRLCWCRQLAVRHWVTAHFRRLQQEPGIRCLITSGTCLPCSPSAVNSRLYCLGCRTLSTNRSSTVSWHWHCKVVLQQ